MSKCQINGMYAFVLYDNVTDTFIVARDPIGIIPLYIGYGKDGSIWFASEMKALQEHCDHFELFPTGHYMVGKSLGRFKIFKIGSWPKRSTVLFQGSGSGALILWRK